MSWLFSRAMIQAYESSLSSQEQAEEYSEATCSDGEQSAPLSVMPTPHKFWRNDKTMEFSDLSRFGLTCAVLTESRGEELLMSYLAGFPVRTLVVPEKEQESPESAADYGSNLYGLFAKYDPDTCSWKTAQCSLLADSELFSETWPNWGLMRNGGSYLRQTAEPIMREKECGLLPTPSASESGLMPELSHPPKMNARNYSKKTGKHCQMTLTRFVNLWPTPTVNGNYNRKGVSKSSGDGLATAVKMFLTPRATDTGKGEKSETFVKRMGDRGEHCFQSLPSQIGGPLNPPWVEWLMGWPIGWTDLKPLEMDRFLSWQQQHSDC